MGAWPDAVELLSQRLLYDEMPYVFDVTCRSLRMLSITEPELVESILVAYRRASTDPDRLATLERRAVLDR